MPGHPCITCTKCFLWEDTDKRDEEERKRALDEGMGTFFVAAYPHVFGRRREVPFDRCMIFPFRARPFLITGCTQPPAVILHPVRHVFTR